MNPEPLGGTSLVPFAGGDGDNCSFGVVDARLWFPSPSVDVDEKSQRDPSGAFVAVRKWMVARQSNDQDRRLVDEVWVEIVVTEPGRRACNAESARSRLVTFITVVSSRPVTAAAIAR